MKLTIINTTDYDLTINGFLIKSNSAKELVLMEGGWHAADEIPALMHYYVSQFPKSVLTIT